jgi:shikimate kinase
MIDYPERIYLAGFMGCGKSTIGPILANVLGYDFWDLDEAIEEHLGSSISSYFKLQGEAAFRKVETDQLRETANLSPYVISLGGGALASDQNLKIALGQGLVIYLRVSADTLVQRLRRSRNRPMLQDKNGRLLSEKALHSKIEHLLNKREPYYMQAHLVLDLSHIPIGLAVDAVMDALRQWRRG